MYDCTKYYDKAPSKCHYLTSDDYDELIDYCSECQYFQKV